MEEEQIEQDKEVYFEDMDIDSGIPELDLGGYSLGVPRTRFSTANFWY